MKRELIHKFEGLKKPKSLRLFKIRNLAAWNTFQLRKRFKAGKSAG